MPTKKTKHLLLLAAAVGVACTSVASAVSIGVNANNGLGAGVSVTSTCQPTSGAAINVSYPDAGLTVTSGAYTASSVNLSAIAAACNGKNIKLAVLDASNATLASYSGTIAGTSLTAALSSAVPAANIAGVAIVING